MSVLIDNDVQDVPPDFEADYLGSLGTREKPGAQTAANAKPLWLPPDPIGSEEWTASRPAPDCIVDRYLYADVAVDIAPGGTGKTTRQLFEAIHIVLGRPLYGLKVYKPGNVVFITAEDDRQMLVARLRLICEAMHLSHFEIERIKHGILISDVSGMNAKLTLLHEGVVIIAALVDAIIDGCLELNPVLIVIDPAVSFGVGESKVNDNEQGLIEAARKIRRELRCCVRYVHHSGKQNAREKTTDQYSGRGGSALPDGCRMVSVTQPMSAEEWHKATGDTLAPGENGTVLSRPKLSYCPPQSDLYLKRTGYAFSVVEPAASDKGAILRRRAKQVIQFLKDEMRLERLHSKNTLESTISGMSRSEARDAMRWLLENGYLTQEERGDTHPGGAKHYLHPHDKPFASPETTANQIENQKENG
jgi:RecA-family ATPase